MLRPKSSSLCRSRCRCRCRFISHICLCCVCPLLSHYSRVVKVSFIRFAFSCSLCIFEWAACVRACVEYTPSSSGCLLTCCCWYFSWNESRIYTKHRETERARESNNYGAQRSKRMNDREQLNTFGWGITHKHESRWWCAQQDSEIPISSVTMILFSCSVVFFPPSSVPLPLLRLFFSSSLHVHFHPSIRIHMSAHKWLYHFEWRRRPTMMGKWFSLIFKKLSAYLII